MSNRIIKESILTSLTMAKLSATAERHFYRLLLTVDDYGCFEALPQIILGRCYPLMMDKIKIKDIESYNKELVKANILKFWVDNGKTYGYFVSFDEHNSKYCVTKDGKPTRHRRRTPEPPFAKVCQSLPNPNPNPKHNPIPNPNPNGEDQKINISTIAHAFPKEKTFEQKRQEALQKGAEYIAKEKEKKNAKV